MTRYEWWDGGDAYGVAADIWRQQPVPEGGRLLFVLDDEGRLLLAQSSAPTSGLAALNEGNLEQWRDALEAVVNPPAGNDAGTSTAGPSLDDVAAQVAAQQETIDALVTMLVEGA